MVIYVVKKSILKTNVYAYVVHPFVTKMCGHIWHRELGCTHGAKFSPPFG